MKDKIFLITPDKTLQELEAAAYASEELLQRLLSDYPDLLAGYQMNEANPRRWLLVTREIRIPDEPDASDRWSLDHLFLDQDGTPTLVEVKRATDSRIRREVAGQMLDYAANAVLHWSPEFVRQRFEARCKDGHMDPAEAVAGLLGIDSDANEAIEAFWELVYNKLKTGQVRLVFVADRIPKELRRIIEFLNEHMKDVEVLGVELPQYVGSGLTTIVPKVIGLTSAAEQTKRSGGGQQWDEEHFFEAIRDRNDEKVARTARRILEWAVSRQLSISWGKGTIDGSFVPSLELQRTLHKLFGVWTYGSFEFYFQHYKAPFDTESKRRELWSKINEILPNALPSTSISRRPTIKLTSLNDSVRLDQLLAVFDWFLEEVRQAS